MQQTGFFPHFHSGQIENQVGQGDFTLGRQQVLLARFDIKRLSYLAGVAASCCLNKNR